MHDIVKMVYKIKGFFLLLMVMGSLTLSGQSETEKKLIGISEDKLLFADGSELQLPSLKFDEVRLFVFVRHAEKDTIGFDPGLLDEGNLRADRLARIFASVDLEAIYSTPFRRTNLTAYPLANGKQLETLQYDPGHLDHFIKEVLWKGEGNMLVVGHSNTTPLLLNKILGEDRFEQIPENEYQHIFMIEKYPNGKLRMYEFSF